MTAELGLSYRRDHHLEIRFRRKGYPRDTVGVHRLPNVQANKMPGLYLLANWICPRRSFRRAREPA